MTRIGPLALLLVLCSLGCGSTPGDIPAADDSITDTPSSETVHETDNDTHSGSSGDSATDPSTATDGTDSQTTDTTLPTDTGSSTPTDSATNSATDNATDSTTDTAPTPCELLAADDPNFVCCPVKPPDSCLASDWTFSERDRTYGCCAADLKSHIHCENNSTLFVEYCTQGCGVSSDALFCNANSCEHPFAVSEFPSTLTGDFQDYTNSFSPSNSNSCGDGGGGEDVWFLILVPGASAVVVTQAATTNTTLRLVSGCGVGSCLERAESPETMILPNADKSPRTFTLILSEATPVFPIYPPTNFELNFRLQPR